jgi:hypothetical protein
MKGRSSYLVSACVGKTIKSVSDIPSDRNPLNDDTDGFVIEFTDGTMLTVSAMSDSAVGIVGVQVEPSK